MLEYIKKLGLIVFTSIVVIGFGIFIPILGACIFIVSPIIAIFAKRKGLSIKFNKIEVGL